jgi:hypothetical protein
VLPLATGQRVLDPLLAAAGTVAPVRCRRIFCFGTIVTAKAPNPVLEPLLAAAGAVGLFKVHSGGTAKQFEHTLPRAVFVQTTVVRLPSRRKLARIAPS